MTESKPAKWDATFQAYDINGKSLLEVLKKLAAHNILKQNGPETNYSRQLMQYNPNLKGKFSKRPANKHQRRQDNSEGNC